MTFNYIKKGIDDLNSELVTFNCINNELIKAKLTLNWGLKWWFEVDIEMMIWIRNWYMIILKWLTLL